MLRLLASLAACLCLAVASRPAAPAARPLWAGFAEADITPP